MGLPPSGMRALGTSPPMRTPAPAATMMATVDMGNSSPLGYEPVASRRTAAE